MKNQMETRMWRGLHGNLKRLVLLSAATMATAAWGITLNEALDNYTLTFTEVTSHSTARFWSAQTAYNHDGEDAARSGYLYNGQTNYIYTTVTGPGVISFWFAVSSESDRDEFEFLIDGKRWLQYSGYTSPDTLSWIKKSFSVGTGSHKLTWKYGKSVSGSAGLDAAFLDQVEWIQQPENDYFADATLIDSAVGSAEGTTVNSTVQDNEPLPKFISSLNTSIWWTWTASADCNATFDTTGSAIDTVMGVYAGTSLASLAKVAENDDAGSDHSSRCTFSAVCGTKYYIAVSGYKQGKVKLNWTIRPVNDNVEQATRISGAIGAVQGTTAGASVQPGEPLPKFMSAATSTVWWLWTAPADGPVQFDTTGAPGIDTVMGVYRGGTLSNMDVIDENDDFEGSKSRCTFVARKGLSYAIAVSGYGSRQDPITLSWLQRPANDDFEDAETIIGESGTWSGSTTRATVQAGEPLPEYATQAKNTIWWVWTAPASGNAVIHTENTTFDTVMGVYTGSSVSSLAKVVEDDDGGPNRTSRCAFSAVAGTKYYIAVSGYDNNNHGTVVVHWDLSVPKIYTVTLDPQDGNGGTASVRATYGADMPPIEPPTRDGYVFGGYFSGKDGVNPQYYDANGKSARTWNRAWNSTIYAKWISASYTVTLDAQGGGGGVPSVKAAYGYALPAVAVPTKTGYVFGGYFSGKDGVAPQFYDANGKCVTAWNRKWNSTIYAKWVPAPYTVTLDNVTGSKIAVSAAYGYALPPVTPPKRAGYVFGGYFSGKDGVAPQFYDENGKCVLAWNRKWSSTIYAKWIAAPYTVTLDRQNGSGGDTSVKVAYDHLMPAITVPTKSGYVFGGYFSGKDGVNPQYYDADGKCVMAWNRKWGSTIYAKWIPAPYTVTLDRQNGSGGSVSVKVAYGYAMPAITIPTKSGYVFGGYFSGKDGVAPQYYDANGKSVTAWNRKWGSTIYAKWIPSQAAAAPANRRAVAVPSISEPVPDWAIGTFYGENEDSFATISVSRDGVVSGTVLFADGAWTISGNAKGRCIEALATDLYGNVKPVLLFIVQTDDGRCRIESADGLAWTTP